MAEVAKVAVVPVVPISVYSVAHILRVPGGGSLLATYFSFDEYFHMISPDAGSTGLAEILGGCSHRVAAIVAHPLVRDQPIPGEIFWSSNTLDRFIKELVKDKITWE